MAMVMAMNDRSERTFKVTQKKCKLISIDKSRASLCPCNDADNHTVVNFFVNLERFLGMRSHAQNRIILYKLIVLSGN